MVVGTAAAAFQPEWIRFNLIGFILEVITLAAEGCRLVLVQMMLQGYDGVKVRNTNTSSLAM